MEFKTYTTSSGEELLYVGNPDVNLFDELVKGPADIWHSSKDQGYYNSFYDLIHQACVFWWYLKDIEEHSNVINWRINPNAFVIRKEVWEQLSGLDDNYIDHHMKGLDLGYNVLSELGGIPHYVKGLFPAENNTIVINPVDRYIFFNKYYAPQHSYYMMIKKGGLFGFFKEYKAYKKAKTLVQPNKENVLKARELKPIEGNPTVSLVIPTMRRQKFAQLLLDDHKTQTYPITQAVIVDATPEDERDDQYYRQEDFDFKVDVFWQTSKGSCRARNEAIDQCTGDYIIFADDDVRILPDFVENHVRLLQTYNAAGCNGLDIMAKHEHQTIDDLKEALANFGKNRWRVGATYSFSNANSCVRKEVVNEMIGNDVNFDGGYGEDGDFGQSMTKKGHTILVNPFSPNLHLKPALGGYRWWGTQAKILGKKRKKQPWEFNHPVKVIRPVPSPTVMYRIMKHYNMDEVKEYRRKYFLIYLFKGKRGNFISRLLSIPYKQLQFNRSLFYAKKLVERGVRYK